MANKNIIVSNNGKYESISASVDSDNNELSSSIPILANTASFTNQNGIMQIYNGKIIPVNNTSISNAQSNYSGSLLSYDVSEGFGPQRTANASFSGDISGDVGTGIRVRNISNVTGGVLQSLYGGLGVSSHTPNSIITPGGVSIAPGVVGKIISGNSGWEISDVTILNSVEIIEKPIIYLYTGVQSTQWDRSSTQYIWKKPGTVGSLFPNINPPRFIRVICQGAGSSGDSGYTIHVYSHKGGSGGGYSDVTFNGYSIADSVTCLAGNGGGRPQGFRNGVFETTYGGLQGGLGGHTSFGSYIFADGGHTSNTQTAVPNYGGIGYTRNGGNGGFGGQIFPQTGDSVTIGGAGGGGGGNNSAVGGVGGSVTLMGANPTSAGVPNGGTAPNPTPVGYFKFKNIVLNNIPNSSLPNIVCAGGSGGAGTTSSGRGGGGGHAEWGSGGGGGGRCSTQSQPSRGGGQGGNGGKGYLLIICY